MGAERPFFLAKLIEYRRKRAYMGNEGLTKNAELAGVRKAKGFQDASLNEDGDDAGAEGEEEDWGFEFDVHDSNADIRVVYEDDAFRVFTANSQPTCAELVGEMKDIDLLSEPGGWYGYLTSKEKYRDVFFIDDKKWKKRRMFVVRGSAYLYFSGSKRTESAATWIFKRGTEGLIKFFVDNNFAYISSFLKGKKSAKDVSDSGVFRYPDDVRASSRARSSATRVKIKKGVRSIPNSALYNLAGVKELTIPEGVTRIGDSACGNMRSLEKVYLPDTLREIGDYAFAYIADDQTKPIIEIFIPKSVVKMGCGICSMGRPWGRPAEEESQPSKVRFLCEAASKPSGWDSEWNVSCWYYFTGSYTPPRYDVEWGVSRPESARPPESAIDEDYDGFDLTPVDMNPVDPDNIPEDIAHAIIDEYFDRHKREYTGYVTAEDARDNCYRPWGREVSKWWLRRRVDDTWSLMGEVAVDAMGHMRINLINIAASELDDILSDMGMRLDSRRLEEYEGDDVFVASDDRLAGLSGSELRTMPGADGDAALIRRFRNKRYWFISLSDGEYERLDGFDLGGEYAKLCTYDEALRLWETYPLDEEIALRVEDNPDDSFEVHVELHCITDAEFENAGEHYDDELAADNDFFWSESAIIADRYYIYSPDCGDD